MWGPFIFNSLINNKIIKINKILSLRGELLSSLIILVLVYFFLVIPVPTYARINYGGNLFKTRIYKQLTYNTNQHPPTPLKGGIISFAFAEATSRQVSPSLKLRRDEPTPFRHFDETGKWGIIKRQAEGMIWSEQ
ncbi:MAG: hypothetical protein GX926_02930 [Candidatus Magasanikbacteria bacterium]|nr:hypothetical protein [Candidatus Magasanikbacteria bacterium]